MYAKGRLPSCSLCQKARFRCIYAIRSPHAPDSGVMFHSVPRDIGHIRTNEGPSQTDASVTFGYDLSRYLAGDTDSRQHSVGMAGPLTSDSSGSSEMSYNFNDALPRQRQTLGWMQQFPAQFDMSSPEFDVDASAFEHSSDAPFGAIDHWQSYLPAPPSTTTLPNEACQTQLPSRERVLDMVNSFFSAQHQLLPSVHRESFMTRLSKDMVGLSSGPFLWVILALYCSCNKSESMQAQYRTWMQTAHAKLELMSTTRVRTNTTNMLQASVWMVFDAYCRGDVTNAWLLLGRAAQLTSALGLDRIDSKRRTARMESELKSRSDIEVEERRKCMWCLALLDRLIVSVNGLALSMDDRYFHVDFPLPDEEFQEAQNSVSRCLSVSFKQSIADTETQIEDIEYLRECYTSEAFDLLNGNATSAMVMKPSFEHVLKVSVILGRALAIQNSIRHDEEITEEQHLGKLRTLESVLNTFCYAASATGEATGPTTSLMRLWLRMLTQCSKLLMLHPPGPSTLGLCKCLETSSPGGSAKIDTECVRAATSAAAAFSNALKGNLLALNNPFLLPVACTSARMLTLLRNQMHEADRERVRGLIDEILRVVDHIALKFPGAAAKARETIMQRVQEMEHGTRRNSLSCYIGLDCE